MAKTLKEKIDEKSKELHLLQLELDIENEEVKHVEKIKRLKKELKDT